MYYKQGVTDPDYCVLKFTAIKEAGIVVEDKKECELMCRLFGEH